MPKEIDSTESLLSRTKRLLATRGDVSLREIATGASVGHEWVRAILYGRIQEAGANKLERLEAYLTDMHAARRFQKRKSS